MGGWRGPLAETLGGFFRWEVGDDTVDEWFGGYFGVTFMCVKTILGGIMALLIVLLSGCEKQPAELQVTKEQYGKNWPYVINSGILTCDPPGSAVVFKSGGVTYAVNGRAIGFANSRGYVIARDTISNGTSAYTLIQAGLAICDKFYGT